MSCLIRKLASFGWEIYGANLVFQAKYRHHREADGETNIWLLQGI